MLANPIVYFNVNPVLDCAFSLLPPSHLSGAEVGASLSGGALKHRLGGGGAGANAARTTAHAAGDRLLCRGDCGCVDDEAAVGEGGVDD